MTTTAITIGRTTSTHLEVREIKSDSISLNVMKGEILQGIAYLSAKSDGYIIHRVEKYTQDVSFSVRSAVVKLLTPKRFRKLMA